MLKVLQYKFRFFGIVSRLIFAFLIIEKRSHFLSILLNCFFFKDNSYGSECMGQRSDFLSQLRLP